MKFMGKSPENPTPAFWRAVDQAREDPAAFKTYVGDLRQRELVELHSAYRDASEPLMEPEYLDHLDEDLSEDSVDELVTWVVSQGEAYYRSVLEDPASMPARAGQWNDLQSILVREYDRRYGKALPAIEDFQEDEGSDSA